jgi:predicted dehydrogenase
MLKIVVIGAGNHSQRNHLSSLAHYVDAHPGEIALAALCDLRRDHAVMMAKRYGFARAYADLDEMLDCEKPDGCVAITPIPVTVQVASRVIRAGVPLLMEKPPGATVEEARSVVDLVEAAGVPVMVSMNRRFDPALSAAMAWKEARPIAYVRGTIVRHKRQEPEFMTGTAIHPLDAMRAIAGDVREFEADSRNVNGVRWYVVRLAFVSGAMGVLEVLPDAGTQAESYEIFGDGYRLLVQMGEVDAGRVCCWEDGQLVRTRGLAQGEPDFVRNGAFGETMSFILALEQGRTLHPSPAQVLQSVELCHAIEEQWRKS